LITELALGCYLTLVGVGAPRALPHCWPGERAPRRTVALLLVLAYSLPLSAIGGGLALGLTLIHRLAGNDPAVDGCADRLPIHDESPVPALLGGFGMAVAGLLVLRVGGCVLASVVNTRLRGRTHLAVLEVCGRTDRALGATVIVHAQAASYCLPGRRGRIVVTSSAPCSPTNARTNAATTTC
jgi:hypothetical protein